MPTAGPPEVDASRERDDSGERVSLGKLLDRPLAERLREYRYRFAQSAVFGAPVIALAVWGKGLGPVDSQRWVGVMQALLAGWVVYVNLGMLVEGIMRKHLGFDLLVTVMAMGIYGWGVVGVIRVLTTGQSGTFAGLFCASVGMLCAWDAIQWWRHARKEREA